MFGFVLRNPNRLLIITRNTSIPITTTHLLHRLRFLHKTPQESNQNRRPSLTVSYLINSCGLSPESALSAAKKINIRTTQKPDSVLNALKSSGFSDTQMAKLINKFPKVLSCNPDNSIRPILEFFVGVGGFSGTQLIRLILGLPNLFTYSLERRIEPNFHLLSSIIGSNNQQIATAVLRYVRLITGDLETNFLPNVRILQSCGVPAPNIAKLATSQPRAVMQETGRFATTADYIKKLGFDPMSTQFVYGIIAVLGMKPSTWERKVALYKSLGWSEGDVVSAFTKQPNCMLLSEEKIRRGMDFFVKKMHWELYFLVANPVLLCLSLEKRVIPRCSVLSVLASKGFVVRNSSAMFLVMSEKDFLNKYIIKYQDQVPEVLRVYHGNLEFIGLKGE